MDDDATTITTTTMFTTNKVMEGCSNWSELHEDMIHLVFKKLTSPADCIRFGSVCVSWRSIQFLCLHPDLIHPQLPLLMIPTPPPPQLLINTSDDVLEETRSFYRVLEKNVYKNLQLNLPYNRYCRGSSHGWLITSGYEDTGYSVELFNPFISLNNEYNKIQLPPLTSFPEPISIPAPNCIEDDYLHKVIVSLNPSSHPKDYVVMAIYGAKNRLCFWRPGDQVWTRVRGFCALDDVIYHKGLFYVVNAMGEVMVIDNLDAGAGAGVRRLAPPRQQLRRKNFENNKKYLVESEGDILLLNKRGRHEIDGILFRVFKLIINKEEEEKKEMTGDGTSDASPEWKVMNSFLKMYSDMNRLIGITELECMHATFFLFFINLVHV